MAKEKISIGLDINNRYINMVKLAKEASGAINLLDFASVDIGLKKGQAEKSKQIERLVQEKGLTECLVNVGVSGESVVVRYIDLPKMKKNEVAQALQYEAQQYIPFKMEEVIFDFNILEPADLDKSKMRILLVAAKKQAIMDFVKLIKQAKLKPNLIDVNSFSLINCFQVSGTKIKPDHVYALVNLEFDLVNINILQKQTPYFTRDISLENETVSLADINGEKKGLFESLRPLFVNLIREIRISIDYYESEFEKQVSTIYVSGEGARITELVSAFGAELGREVSLWNPVGNLKVDSSRIDCKVLGDKSAMLALACGLAIRGLN
ncbi:MAG: type IV pilus assembly protein PilM [Candidatus Omnitrophica bacterium]|nr:type IV pilus assembly protein PilM [Candidatus Omnitrophota bacterium]